MLSAARAPRGHLGRRPIRSTISVPDFTALGVLCYPLFLAIWRFFIIAEVGTDRL
jgi:hypothetical protein